jgi:hypothetical protein
METDQRRGGAAAADTTLSPSSVDRALDKLVGKPQPSDLSLRDGSPSLGADPGSGRCPGPLGVPKRPSRFPQQIVFLRRFRMGARAGRSPGLFRRIPARAVVRPRRASSATKGSSRSWRRLRIGTEAVVVVDTGSCCVRAGGLALHQWHTVV